MPELAPVEIRSGLRTEEDYRRMSEYIRRFGGLALIFMDDDMLMMNFDAYESDVIGMKLEEAKRAKRIAALENISGRN